MKDYKKICSNSRNFSRKFFKITFLLISINFGILLIFTFFYFKFLFKTTIAGSKINELERKMNFILNTNSILTKNKDKLGNLEKIQAYAKNELKMNFPNTVDFIEVIDGKIARGD